MQSESTRRYVVLAAGVVAMLCLGTVYSWSLFTRPLLAAFQWSALKTSMIFAMTIFSLGCGAVVGGRWQDRAGPRKVATFGMILWALGNLLAGLGTARFGYWWLFLTYGAIAGLGNGMAYITPVATVTKWFSLERRGLAGGVVIMGFGLGAVVFNNVVVHVASFDEAARHAALYVAKQGQAFDAGTTFNSTAYALPASDLASIMKVFVGSGVVFAIVGIASTLLLTNPPPSSIRKPMTSSLHPRHSFTPEQALRTPQFYLLWAMLFLNVTAGILIISNAIPIFSDLTGASPAAATSIYGLLAIFNGVGRSFWGFVSDKIGRGRAYVMIFAIQAVVFATMTRLHSPLAVGIAFAIVLLCFGGGFAVMPSFNADYFGTTYLGATFGMILTAWGVAGVVGPLIAGVVKDRTGSFAKALLPVAAMLVCSVLLPMVIRRPRRPERASRA